jgi:2-oxoglutarate decarboxylase
MSVDTTTQVVMPQMGDSVAEGTILEWHKHEGDHVEADETLVEISTDKVDAEVPAGVAGTVVRLLAAEGDTVAVGSALAEIATNGAAPNGGAPTAEAPAPDAPEPAAAPESAAAAPEAAPVANGDAIASPVARRAAAAHGVALDQVAGSGSPRTTCSPQ